jgi:vitamin B12 transporter
LFLAASLRQDDNEDSEDFRTWRTQASLKVPGTVVRLHASAGTGVKYATFGDLYGKFGGYVPNPNLKPETSKGWDAGAETTLLGGRTILDVTYFEANLKNEFKENYSSWPTITTENMTGISHRSGVEVSLRQKVVDGIVLGSAYTFSDPRDDKDLGEIRRPKHSGKVNLDWAFAQGRGHLGLAASYNGARTDRVFPLAGAGYNMRMDNVWLLGATASYKLTDNMELFGRVENILDNRYQDIFGYQASGGVTAYAGVKFTFEDPNTASWAKFRD